MEPKYCRSSTTWTYEAYSVYRDIREFFPVTRIGNYLGIPSRCFGAILENKTVVFYGRIISGANISYCSH